MLSLTLPIVGLTVMLNELRKDYYRIQESGLTGWRIFWVVFQVSFALYFAKQIWQACLNAP